MDTITVKSIKKKGADGGFASVPIGAELRYIGPLRNTNVNNLEEQLLIGYDCVTETWTENYNTGELINWTEKHFWNGVAQENTPTEYYKLIIKEYSEAKVKISEILNDPEKYSLYIDDALAEGYSIDDNGNIIDADGNIVEDDRVITVKKVVYNMDELLALVSENNTYMYFQPNTTYDADAESGESNPYGTIYINPPELTTEESWLFYHVAGKGDLLLLKKEKSSQYCTIKNPRVITEVSTDRSLVYEEVKNQLRTIERITHNYLLSENNTWREPFSSSEDSLVSLREQQVSTEEE